MPSRKINAMPSFDNMNMHPGDSGRRRRPGEGRGGYVPSTRAGRDDPRRTSLGSQARGGGRKGRTVQSQRGQGQYRSERNYRTLAGHDTGYSLKGRGQRINFDSRTRDLLGRYGISNRMLLLAAAGVVLLLILVLSVSSCVRGCSPQAQGTSDSTEVNQWDSRVAAGVSEHLTSELTLALNQQEKITQIAQNANKYADERICELATLEPESIDFVAAFPTAEKTSSAYGEGNERGSFPLLYNWDVRWGYVDYAGSVLGVNGSGPTTMAMAYMGLTGKTEKSPADFAKDASDKRYVTEKEPFTSAEFFAFEAGELGLDAKEYTPSGDNLSTILSEGGRVVAVQLKANFTSPYAHWALVVGKNSDGSVSLYDPCSAKASSHSWTVGAIGNNSEAFCALSHNAEAATEAGAEGA